MAHKDHVVPPDDERVGMLTEPDAVAVRCAADFPNPVEEDAEGKECEVCVDVEGIVGGGLKRDHFLRYSQKKKNG